MFKTILGSIGIIAIAILVIFILIYNKLVRIKNITNELWSNIDTQIKKRYDLIPSLIATVKSHSNHESATLERVAQLRTIAMSANNMDQKIKTENNLTNGLKTLLASAQNYPDLKNSHNFDNLQKELSLVESKLQLASRYYNIANKEYNHVIANFPISLIAKLLKYKPQAYFEINTI